MLNKRYDIYLGCSDKYKVLHDNSLEFTTKMVAKILSTYQMGFSITKQLGGYTHEDGTYILEDSLKISVIGEIESKTAENFIKDLKTFFDQETILVSIQTLGKEYK